MQVGHENSDCRPISRCISEMIQDRPRDIVWNTNGTIFNDLECPVTYISRSRHFLTLISQKRYEIENGGTYTCPTQECHIE